MDISPKFIKLKEVRKGPKKFTFRSPKADIGKYKISQKDAVLHEMLYGYRPLENPVSAGGSSKPDLVGNRTERRSSNLLVVKPVMLEKELKTIEK